MVTTSRAISAQRFAAQPLIDQPIDTSTRSEDRRADLHLVVDLRTEGEPRIEIDLRPYLTEDAGLITASAVSLRAKRIMDVIGSILLLVLFSPILLIAALAVKLTSPGPVIFKQQRVGKDGREFEFYKFRSMRASAEEERPLLDDDNEADGPIFKIQSDPRITPVGRFLRRTSIDELPQFWNVLIGNMSLVGPRPPLPEEVEQYSDWEYQRLAVVPGVTGIWQVSGRSDLDFETWVSMDIQYIQEWHPWLDFTLLARTVPAVLSGRGAY